MQAAADFCSVTAVQRFCQGFGGNQAFRHSLAHCPPCVNGHRVRHRHGIRQRAAACSTGNQHSQKVSRCYCLIRVKAAIRNPFRWDQVILRGALYGSGIRFMPIPLILASKSKPRRDVLYSAGICPTIRVSHVDEPAALEAAAREEGVTVDDLSIKQRVMILAVAKAEAVHRAYRDVADTAAAATGDRVIAYPLQSLPAALQGIRRRCRWCCLRQGR